MNEKPKCPRDWITNHGDNSMYQGQEDRWFCGECEREEEQQRIVELEDEVEMLEDEIRDLKGGTAPPVELPKIFTDMRIYDWETERYLPLKKKHITISGRIFGIRLTERLLDPDGRKGMVAELYIEDDENWFLVSQFSPRWLEDLEGVVATARKVESQ